MKHAKAKMVTKSQAEALAKSAVKNYFNDCNLQTVEDFGNALMLLISVAGFSMCIIVGQEEALVRLNFIVECIEQQNFGAAQMETMQ